MTKAELQAEIARLSKALKDKEAAIAVKDKALAASPSKEQLAAKDAEIAKLRAAAAEDQPLPPRKIEGTFKATVKTPQGKREEKTFGWKDGAVAVRVPTGIVNHLTNGVVLSTEGLMAIAAGKELTEQQLADSPKLAGVTKEQAQTVLNWFANARYGYLEQIG